MFYQSHSKAKVSAGFRGSTSRFRPRLPGMDASWDGRGDPPESYTYRWPGPSTAFRGVHVPVSAEASWDGRGDPTLIRGRGLDWGIWRGRSQRKCPTPYGTGWESADFGRSTSRFRPRFLGWPGADRRGRGREKTWVRTSAGNGAGGWESAGFRQPHHPASNGTGGLESAGFRGSTSRFRRGFLGWQG